MEECTSKHYTGKREIEQELKLSEEQLKYTNTVQRLGILKLYTFIYYENWNSYIK